MAEKIKNGFFNINDSNGKSQVYRINYRDTEELMKKVIFIELAPELEKPAQMVVNVGRECTLIYFGETAGQWIQVIRVDGREWKDRVKFSTGPDEIDRQYENWTSKEMLKLRMVYNVTRAEYVHISGVY